ncbi:hypothetical protein INS49_014381 [Diaporthe citri]|uniref:uncharacterized protein n=1 Tax=Diaporthe citri TaxID=83186 RepID=UPI001C7E6151|nr:uncharacterized protein INS49_014381 [Diaporthe citri]KAG6358497.1 hypothetical protein INS49_014381 [Diaporthe citri]
MSSLTPNTYRRYKMGTEAMFSRLLEALDKTGITLDTRLEDTSIRHLLNLASRAQRSGASMPYEVLHSLEDALKIRRHHGFALTSKPHLESCFLVVHMSSQDEPGPHQSRSTIPLR